MQVRELMEELSKHSPTAEVRVTWESIYRSITPGTIYRGADGVLYIDADECSYKDDIISGRHVPPGR